MEETRNIICSISVDNNALSNLTTAVTSILENKYINYHGEKNGRCNGNAINLSITLLHIARPRVQYRDSALVGVRFDIKSVVFRTALVIKKCKLIEHIESTMGYSDTGVFVFSLPNKYEDNIVQMCRLVVESQFLLPSQKKNLGNLLKNDEIDLKILDSHTVDNIMVCRCMCDDGLVPIFKLNMNIQLPVLGIKKINEQSYYCVKNGEIVEVTDLKNTDIVNLNNQDLLDYIRFLKDVSNS